MNKRWIFLPFVTFTLLSACGSNQIPPTNTPLPTSPNTPTIKPTLTPTPIPRIQPTNTPESIIPVYAGEYALSEPIYFWAVKFNFQLVTREIWNIGPNQNNTLLYQLPYKMTLSEAEGNGILSQAGSQKIKEAYQRDPAPWITDVSEITIETETGNLSLSPNKEKLVWSEYIGYCPGNYCIGEPVLKIYDLLSGDIQEYRSEVGISSPRWSPDGLHLTYWQYSGNLGELPTLSILNIATVEITTVPGAGADFAWNPSGVELAYLSKDAKEIFIFDLKTQESRVLLESNRGADSIAWSPSGRHIALKGVSQIHIIDLETLNIKTYSTQDDGTYNFIQWSPDGKWLGYYIESKANHLQIMDTSTGEIILDHQIPETIYNWQWSTSSTKILYLVDEVDNHYLAVIDVSNKKYYSLVIPDKIIEDLGQILSPTW